MPHYLRGWIALIGMMSWGTAVFLKRVEQEEKMMDGKFGEEWRGYKRESWRLIPWVW